MIDFSVHPQHLLAQCAIAFFLLLMATLLIKAVFTKIQKHGRLFGLVFLGIAIHMSFLAYPSFKEKNPAADKIYFLQTDPELVYLYDQGSWVSNNTVHLHYNSRFLPESAQLYLDCISKSDPAGSTNYINVLTGTVATWPEIVEFDFAEATSYKWFFYTTYTPGAAVHTNGVAVADFIAAPGQIAVPKRAIILLDSQVAWPLDIENLPSRLSNDSLIKEEQ